MFEINLESNLYGNIECPLTWKWSRREESESVQKGEIFEKRVSYLESNLYDKVEGGGSEKDKREEELVNAPVRILCKYYITLYLNLIE